MTVAEVLSKVWANCERHGGLLLLPVLGIAFLHGPCGGVESVQARTTKSSLLPRACQANSGSGNYAGGKTELIRTIRDFSLPRLVVLIIACPLIRRRQGDIKCLVTYTQVLRRDTSPDEQAHSSTCQLGKSQIPLATCAPVA